MFRKPLPRAVPKTDFRIAPRADAVLGRERADGRLTSKQGPPTRPRVARPGYLRNFQRKHLLRLTAIQKAWEIRPSYQQVRRAVARMPLSQIPMSGWVEPDAKNSLHFPVREEAGRHISCNCLVQRQLQNRLRRGRRGRKWRRRRRALGLRRTLSRAAAPTVIARLHEEGSR